MSRWFYTRNNLFEAGLVVRVLIIGSMVAGFVVGVVALLLASYLLFGLITTYPAQVPCEGSDLQVYGFAAVGDTALVLTSVTKNFLLIGVRTDALMRNDP